MTDGNVKKIVKEWKKKKRKRDENFVREKGD